MTQAFNLSQLANNVNTSGQLSASAGVSGTLPVANGGTGRTTNTAYAVICGGTTAGGVEQSIASVGSAGQVLTSNGAGALPTFQAAGGGGGLGGMQTFTSSGTFTIPSGKTVVKVTVVGGGGSGGGGSEGAGGGGGAGGTAIKYLTGLTPGNTLTVTRGAAGGTSSVSSGTQSISTISATGGGNGQFAQFYSAVQGGAGGSGSGGDANFTGNGGTNGFYVGPGCTQDLQTFGGTGGASIFGGAGLGARTDIYNASGATAGTNGGGGGGGSSNGSASGASGGVGVIVFEF